MCDYCSKLTMWKWSLKLKVSGKGSSPLDYIASKRYEHELKVTTSTIQYSQGPGYSTVQVQCIIIMSSIPLKTPPRTYLLVLIKLLQRLQFISVIDCMCI